MLLNGCAYFWQVEFFSENKFSYLNILSISNELPI